MQSSTIWCGEIKEEHEDWTGGDRRQETNFSSGIHCYIDILAEIGAKQENPAANRALQGKKIPNVALTISTLQGGAIREKLKI